MKRLEDQKIILLVLKLLMNFYNLNEKKMMGFTQ